jgi:TldD protein
LARLSTNSEALLIVARTLWVAYLIENGEITRPVKGATLIGDGPTVLTRVTMIGDDFSFDPGVGACGKSGQWIPAGVGQPSLKISGLTVGGAEVRQP